MPHLQRLDARHAPALLRFELDNRAYFARSVPDRGDDYFARFDARLADLLAEQAAGQCHFHVLIDDDGTVLGRFNLVDVADGSAELGYRVAERATGRGVAQDGVRRVGALARDEYGLHRLVACAALANPASLAVLRRTGFVPVGDVLLNGQPGMRHVLDLTASRSAPPPAGEELATERLSLRRPSPADVDLIYAVHSDPRACAHNPADSLSTRAEAEGLYQRWDEHWRREGCGYWVIHARRRRLGFCGLKVMTLKHRDVLNLFYRLDPAAWGDGVATEAATAVVTWATANRPGYPVIARVRPENVASQRVAARAGLRRAEHLDSQGEDGLDWIFTSHWP